MVCTVCGAAIFYFESLRQQWDSENVSRILTSVGYNYPKMPDGVCVQRVTLDRPDVIDMQYMLVP